MWLRCVWVGSEELERSCQRQTGVPLHAGAAGERHHARQTGKVLRRRLIHSPVLFIVQTLFLTVVYVTLSPLVPDGHWGEDAWFLEDVLGQKDSRVDDLARGGPVNRSVPKRSLRAGWPGPHGFGGEDMDAILSLTLNYWISLSLSFMPSSLWSSCRLYVVDLWHPWPGLGRERCFRKDPLHELQRLPAEVWCSRIWEKILSCTCLEGCEYTADGLNLWHLYIREWLYSLF